MPSGPITRVDKSAGDVNWPTENERKIPHVLIMTDIGHDIDDAMALLIAGNQHRERKCKIEGVIATLDPELDRAKLAYHVLRQMGGIDEIKVAKGTKGRDKPWPSMDYEMLREALELKIDPPSYLNFTVETLKKVAKEGKRLRMLSIAGHRDLWEIIKLHKELFESVVDEVHIQGGCYYGKYQPNMSGTEAEKETEKKKVGTMPEALYPSWAAANNKFDTTASINLYKYLAKNPKIKTTTYVNTAAFKSVFRGKKLFQPKRPKPSKIKLVEYLDTAHTGFAEMIHKSSLNPPGDWPDKNRQWLFTRLVGLEEDTTELRHRLTDTYEVEVPLLGTDGKPLVDKDGNPVTKRVNRERRKTTFKEVEKYFVVVPNDPVATLGCCGVVDAATLKAQQVGPYEHILQVGEGVDGEKLSNAIYDIIKAELHETSRAATFHESTLNPDAPI